MMDVFLQNSFICTLVRVFEVSTCSDYTFDMLQLFLFLSVDFLLIMVTILVLLLYLKNALGFSPCLVYLLEHAVFQSLKLVYSVAYHFSVLQNVNSV